MTVKKRNHWRAIVTGSCDVEFRLQHVIARVHTNKPSPTLNWDSWETCREDLVFVLSLSSGVSPAPIVDQSRQLVAYGGNSPLFLSSSDAGGLGMAVFFYGGTTASDDQCCSKRPRNIFFLVAKNRSAQFATPSSTWRWFFSLVEGLSWECAGVNARSGW